jgi:hypothetical protein
MRHVGRALTIPACVFAILSFGPAASADDNNSRIVTQNKTVISIQSAYCGLPTTPDGASCNPPCPPGGCPGHCISGQCIKQILK